MSLGSILLGLINIAIVVAVLLLIGACILWFLSWLSFPVPDMVQKLYIAVVALIALYMLVALLLGIPTVRIIGGKYQDRAPGAYIPPGPSIMVNGTPAQLP
jgi:hypothetical protein